MSTSETESSNRSTPSPRSVVVARRASDSASKPTSWRFESRTAAPPSVSSYGSGGSSPVRWPPSSFTARSLAHGGRALAEAPVGLHDVLHDLVPDDVPRAHVDELD